MVDGGGSEVWPIGYDPILSTSAVLQDAVTMFISKVDKSDDACKSFTCIIVVQ